MVNEVIKLLGCIMIMCSTTAFGFNCGEKLKNRTNQLRQTRRCIYEIQNHIVYTHTTLPEAIFDAASKVEKPISILFMEVSGVLSENRVNNVYEAFKQAFSNKAHILSLKDEDIDIILDFSKSLGESDIEGQKNIFSLAIESLKKQIDRSEIILKKNMKMYRYLGFSAGAVVTILLI
ncbi:MAG: stage III sporulation protein SpoAB [Clostridium sp.]|jgi:stage III sporulation protein AB|uniref:stage III sporulation protein SpoIIIAB n=1 Tax=Clostridium sp. TaxID=1506 RepID=UPI0025BDDAEC|nr:stage III sporulation protein SpoIIIAB [Clostridium sp.]MCH3964155.1 stage III sporulation protein SpoAB [Clostridium sp.]MCI1715336.1 stage III sporulation protein SpoAB [Clostridium sp.]MCI1799873.1 stage III sporulation protein SpoAB [Clostridium sp.]MCI1813519.1 stage III sporulation protein SpoAB [Clostridium sp.]MCI1870691.1 stage III sporulation protein SpoAB [Clostridium sp.]